MRRHGHSPSNRRRTPTYNSWRAMVERCTYPPHPFYADYGGRGIRVCDRWRHSFAVFLADMGARPVGHTLDRLDVDGDYEPGNCRWSTVKQQRWNRRDMAARLQLAIELEHGELSYSAGASSTAEMAF
jgi:hypothetical protein